MPPSTTAPKPRKPSTPSLHNHSHHSTSSFSSSLFCRHHSPSATATLDLLILILVLISGTFLLTSYFSYLFTSLSLLLPHHLPAIPPLAYVLGVIFSFTLIALCRAAPGFRVRKCGNPHCKGLKKALEFDLQLQTEDCLKNGSNSVGNSNFVPSVRGAGENGKVNNGDGKITSNQQVVDVERLPWKGGSETNPDYECLRAELRKMAPPSGRAVLLFRAKCGCPVAKLVGWGPKKGRKFKKALSSTAVNSDHR